MTLLNHIITVHLCPQASTEMNEKLPQCLEQLQTEKNRLIALFLRLADLPAGNPRRTAAVRYWQRSVVRLLDVLRGYDDISRAHKAIATHYEEATQLMLEIMTSLEQHFRDDLSPELLLPQTYARVARSLLLPRLLKADKGMSLVGIEAPFRRLVLEPAWNFMERPEESITFGELFFLRDLITKLLIFTHPAHAGSGDPVRDIHHLLVSLNFNAAGYFVYCVEAVRREMYRYESLRERMKVLAWCTRELKRRQPDSRLRVLRPGGFHIRDQLLVWLQEERIFIRQLMAPARETAEAASWSTRLTVPQAALMARVYLEEGLVKTASLQQVFTSLADMLHLRKADAGAEDSFRVKYQHPSLSTVTACKQWIARVLVRLNDYETQLRTGADN
ncbi:hypothetical protein WJU16_16720 [Chitinophaga pollutisoli]|uniref:Uncharacterized protein n=1 Tax=Chitinophaga pollutisoli TaxID=3133966 RepID=A0ABZ2YIU9_9BACT